MTKKLEAFVDSMAKILRLLRLSAAGQVVPLEAAPGKQPELSVLPLVDRQSSRFQMRRPVYFSGEDLQGEGQVVNISLLGCAIESEVKVRKGALLQLEITLFDEEVPMVVAHTSVAWSRDSEFGVSFTDVEPEAAEQLRRYASSLRREARRVDRSTSVRRAEEPASETGSQELQNLLQAFESSVQAMKKLARRDVATQVNERKRLARRLGLSERLLQMYEEFEHLPERHRSLLKQWGCLVADPPPERKEQGNVITLTLNGTAYSLTFTESSRFANERVYASLDLCDASGDLLFSALVEVEVNKAMSAWGQRGVEAFVPGDWVKDVLKLSTFLAAQLAVDEADSTQQFAIRQTEALKKRFGLD